MNRKQLPKLPYGQGTYSYIRGSDNICFRKPVKLGNGEQKRVAVVGSTIRECDELMAQKISELNKRMVTREKQPLSEAMMVWLQNTKKDSLKEQSYNRLESTIRNQIETNPISEYSYDVIKSDQLQSLINDLNKKKYSKSVIKKTYDALNDFYRYVHKKYKIDNPMDLVTMPVIEKIKAETKEIEFFEQDDIDAFVLEADATWNTGGLRYPYGHALAANIYLGLRIGELLVLTWEDIDFENGTIFINKTLIEKKNPEYDDSDPELMKEKKIPKMICAVQKTTKTRKTRYVPINSKAKELLRKQYAHAYFKESEDFVICSKNKKLKTIKNIADTLIRMETAADMNVITGSTHVLRHTCASLYFRNGVPIETICKILGNTREVCEATYVHFIDEQLKSAASKITAIEV